LFGYGKLLAIHTAGLCHVKCWHRRTHEKYSSKEIMQPNATSSIFAADFATAAILVVHHGRGRQDRHVSVTRGAEDRVECKESLVEYGGSGLELQIRDTAVPGIKGGKDNCNVRTENKLQLIKDGNHSGINHDRVAF